MHVHVQCVQGLRYSKYGIADYVLSHVAHVTTAAKHINGRNFDSS
jgi:hypothetical protein